MRWWWGRHECRRSSAHGAPRRRAQPLRVVLDPRGRARGGREAVPRRRRAHQCTWLARISRRAPPPCCRGGSPRAGPARCRVGFRAGRGARLAGTGGLQAGAGGGGGHTVSRFVQAGRSSGSICWSHRADWFGARRVGSAADRHARRGPASVQAVPLWSDSLFDLDSMGRAGGAAEMKSRYKIKHRQTSFSSTND